MITLTTTQVESLENDSYSNILATHDKQWRNIPMLDITQFYGMTTIEEVTFEVARQNPTAGPMLIDALCKVIGKAVLGVR